MYGSGPTRSRTAEKPGFKGTVFEGPRHRLGQVMGVGVGKVLPQSWDTFLGP